MYVVPGPQPLAVINIRNVGACSDREKSVSVFKGKIHLGFFWRVSHWLMALAAFYCQEWTRVIFSSSWNFPKPDQVFMREAVFSFFSECGEGKKKNRDRNVEVAYPNHRRNLNRIRHFMWMLFLEFSTASLGLFEEIGKWALNSDLRPAWYENYIFILLQSHQKWEVAGFIWLLVIILNYKCYILCLEKGILKFIFMKMIEMKSL